MTSRSEQRLTKRQQRLADKGTQKVNQRSSGSHVTRKNSPAGSNMYLNPIEPMTHNQALALEAYQNEKTVVMIGCAGTGKSFLACYSAMSEVEDKSSPVEKVLIVRSPQATKNIGFLPGTEQEKIAPFEAAYKDLFADLYGRGDAYEVLKAKGTVRFVGTSFLRGTAIDDTVIIIDEPQSMSFHELMTVLTRAGRNSRIIMCGDTKQDDLTSLRYNEQSGLPEVLNILDRVGSVEVIRFEPKDIVRSGFVRALLTAAYEMGY